MTLAVLDASIAIALLDGSDAHHDSAWRVVHGLCEEAADLVFPVSAYSEVLVGALRNGPTATKILETFCKELVRHVAPITMDTARLAAELRLRHPVLRLPDALVIATGEELDADVVLTADRRWKRASKRVRVV